MGKKITRLGSEGQVSLNAQLVWVKDSSITLGMTGFSLGIREKEGRFALANLSSFSLLSRIDLVIPNPEDSG